LNSKLTGLLLIVYFILLPYISRIGGGPRWVAQYLPDEGMLVPGLIFFALFSSIPAVTLIGLAPKTGDGDRFPLILALVVMSLLTIAFNYDYDLASDAQAAIGLVIFPIVVASVGFATFLLGKLILWLVSRAKRGSR
jgi:hypothetical protein